MNNTKHTSRNTVEYVYIYINKTYVHLYIYNIPTYILVCIYSKINTNKCVRKDTYNISIHTHTSCNVHKYKYVWV